MPLSEIQNLSPKKSSPGKSGKPKPSLSLTCPPPPFIGINNRRTEGFLSPALIPIPSPNGVDTQSAPAPNRSQSPACGVFQWSINHGGSGNVMLLSPLPWDNGTKNNIPMAPHLSEFKDCFSPLPATPRKDRTEDEDSVFEQMQSQYLLSRAAEEVTVYEVTENGEIVNTSRRTLSVKANSGNSTPTPSTATTPTLTSVKS